MLSYDIKGTEESERTGRSQGWHEPRVSLEKCLMNSESALWPGGGGRAGYCGGPRNNYREMESNLGCKEVRVLFCSLRRLMEAVQPTAE